MVISHAAPRELPCRKRCIYVAVCSSNGRRQTPLRLMAARSQSSLSASCSHM